MLNLDVLRYTTNFKAKQILIHDRQVIPTFIERMSVDYQWSRLIANKRTERGFD